LTQGAAYVALFGYHAYSGGADRSDALAPADREGRAEDLRGGGDWRGAGRDLSIEEVKTPTAIPHRRAWRRSRSVSQSGQQTGGDHAAGRR
jgi:hypothetical protein